MRIESAQIPLKRPHFHLRGGELYFMISKRSHLVMNDDEVALWNRIDGAASVGELEAGCPETRSILARWWKTGIIEIAATDFPAGRRKVLVIEPHMDDAILSVGGIMWGRRNTHEFVVASLVGVSNFTSYHRIDRDYFDVAAVTALRCEESSLIMRLLGGRHLAMDCHDAPLRYQPGNWTPDWFRKNRRSIAAFINQAPVADEVKRWAEEIGRLIRETAADEVWFPMGVGTSTDHETTRNSCLLALMEMRNGTEVCLYQDVPYAMNFPWHTGQILDALKDAGADLQTERVDVTSDMPEKLRLISIFASQFKMSYMGHRVENTARLAAAGSGGFGEFIVRANRLPASVDLFELYSGRDHVRKLSRSLETWAKRHRKARRITLLCPMGVGRWKDLMGSLLDIFPDSGFDIYLTADGVDETSRFASPRIRIHPVRPSPKAWLCTILRVLIRIPRPLVVLTGWKIKKAAPLIGLLRFPFDAIPAISIGHLVSALQLRNPRS